MALRAAGQQACRENERLVIARRLSSWQACSPSRRPQAATPLTSPALPAGESSSAFSALSAVGVETAVRSLNVTPPPFPPHRTPYPSTALSPRRHRVGTDSFSRREFVKTAGTAAAASLLGVTPALATPQSGKRRYAIVGTGDPRDGHVGTRDPRELLRRRRLRRPVRHQPEARRGLAGDDGRRPAPPSRTSTRCARRRSPTC